MRGTKCQQGSMLTSLVQVVEASPHMELHKLIKMFKALSTSDVPELCSGLRCVPDTIHV